MMVKCDNCSSIIVFRKKYIKVKCLLCNYDNIYTRHSLKNRINRGISMLYFIPLCIYIFLTINPFLMLKKYDVFYITRIDKINHLLNKIAVLYLKKYNTTILFSRFFLSKTVIRICFYKKYKPNIVLVVQKSNNVIVVFINKKNKEIMIS